MKEIKKYISRNWFWIATGMILTEIAVRAAYEQRGCLRYGGEWFTLPLILMIAEIARNVVDMIHFLLETGDSGDGED